MWPRNINANISRNCSKFQITLTEVKGVAVNFKFMGPCIILMYSSITKRMQLYTKVFIVMDALHVSGSSSAWNMESIYSNGYNGVKLHLVGYAWIWCQGSVSGIVTSLWTGQCVVQIPAEANHPPWLWGPPSLVFNM